MIRLDRIFYSSQFGRAEQDDQCDCACAISDDSVALDLVHLSETLHQSRVYQSNLALSYKLLFNQTQGREVVILDETSYALWKSFKTPAVSNSLSGVDQDLAQQMVRLGILESFEAQAYTCQPVSDQLNIWLHVTNSCNLLCSYCYVNKSNEHMSLETGIAAIDAAFRSALASGFKKITFKYAGGEPTLRLDTVFQLHEYAQQMAARHKIEMNAVILSNGVGLNQEILEEIRARGMRLSISLDGVGYFHDAQRPLLGGQGSYEKVWKTLEQAVACGMRPFISITVTDESAAGLPDLVSRLLELGLPFNLNFARPVMSGRLPDNQKIIAGLRKAFKRIEENLPEYSLLGSVLDRTFFSGAHLRPCSVGEAYMVIDHNGKVASCQMKLGEPVTNISVENPLQVLKLAESGKNPSVDEKEGCSQCEWKYMCAGGCPLTAYHATGRYEVASPFCGIYKTLYPEILRLEGLRILKYSNTQAS